MPRIAAAFFAFAVLWALSGMILGLYMGAHEDFAMADAHAHINLVGWVTQALYGTFYAITRETKLLWLPRIQFAVSVLGALAMLPALAMFLSHGNDPKYIPLMIGGGMLSALSMLIFAVSVFRELLRERHGTMHVHEHH